MGGFHLMKITPKLEADKHLVETLERRCALLRDEQIWLPETEIIRNAAERLCTGFKINEEQHGPKQKF